MYIRQDTLNVGDDNRIRYSLYNIKGFPQNIVNNIGSIVSIYLDKKVVDKLSPFLPIKIKPDKTIEDVIDTGIKKTLIHKGFMELDSKDLDIINKIIEELDISLDSRTPTPPNSPDFVLEEYTTSESE